MARPPAPIRYLVLLAAVVCLLCAVCAHSQKPVTPPPARAPEANPSANQADAGVPAQQEKPVYFPGTKAPAGFIEGFNR